MAYYAPELVKAWRVAGGRGDLPEALARVTRPAPQVLLAWALGQEDRPFRLADYPNPRGFAFTNLHAALRDLVVKGALEAVPGAGGPAWKVRPELRQLLKAAGRRRPKGRRTARA